MSITNLPKLLGRILSKKDFHAQLAIFLTSWWECWIKTMILRSKSTLIMLMAARSTKFQTYHGTLNSLLKTQMEIIIIQL